MTITKYTGVTNYVSSLPDKPNQDGGLTSAQLKQKFDQFGEDMKAYINNVLTSEIDTTKTSLFGDHKGTWLGFTPVQTDPGIQSVVNNLQEDKLKYVYGVVADGVTDDTAALQDALDNETNLLIPGTCLVSSTLNVTNPYTTIYGLNQLYSQGKIKYTGSGTLFNVSANVNYIFGRNLIIEGSTTISTDYYKQGSVGIDITAGNTSIVLDNVYIKNFETLVKANYNNFYNKFINCRFEQALTCLYHFSLNNLVVKGSRFIKFNNAIIVNGTGGPLSVENNSFEIFNGNIIQATGSEKGIAHFRNNYVEIYDNTDLPTNANFPTNAATGAKAGKFGGNILFAGLYGTLVIENNELQLGGVFRISSCSSIDNLISQNNNIKLYTTNNNLDSMFGGVTQYKTYYINDRKGDTIGADGGYSRTYAQLPLNIENPYNRAYLFDCLFDKKLHCPQKVLTCTMLNGWTSSQTTTYGALKAIVCEDGLLLQGVIDGTSKTANIFTNIPANYRPLEIGTTRGYCAFFTFSAYGGGTLANFRYLYNTGDIQVEGTPTSVANLLLDGIFIPNRI